MAGVGPMAKGTPLDVRAVRGGCEAEQTLHLLWCA
jgi:hypothetical protein